MPLIYFTDIEKCCVGVADVPQKIMTKLIKYHLNPMDLVREDVGFAIWASQNSGFRPYNWEKARGRSGGSQHCFGQKRSGVIDPNAKGAVDWTCTKFKENHLKLLKSMLENTDYTRFAIYDGFIHADYKKTFRDRREIYTSTALSDWTLMETR